MSYPAFSNNDMINTGSSSFGSSTSNDFKNRLKTSVAYNRGLLETVNDKVLLEMNERAKNYLKPEQFTTPTSSSPIRAAAAVASASRGPKSPRSARMSHHKRYSSIHRRHFAKMDPITSHYAASNNRIMGSISTITHKEGAATAEEQKYPNQNGKREGTEKSSESGSPTKRRRMENTTESMSKFVFPQTNVAIPSTSLSKPQHFVSSVTPQTSFPRTQSSMSSYNSNTRQARLGINSSHSKPAPLGIMDQQRINSSAQPERSLRTVKSIRNMKSTHCLNLNRDKEKEVSSSVGSTNIMQDKENNNFSIPTTNSHPESEKKNKVLPREISGQKTNPRIIEHILKAGPSVGHLPKPRNASAPSSASVNQIRPTTITSNALRSDSKMTKSFSSRSIQSFQSNQSNQSNQPPTTSRIPRSTTLQSMRSTDNLRAAYKPSSSTHHDPPPSTPTASRLLKSRTIAKSSPNLNALTRDIDNRSSVVPRPVWR